MNACLLIPLLNVLFKGMPIKRTGNDCFHSLLSEILHLFVPRAHPWSNSFLVHWMRMENQAKLIIKIYREKPF